MPRATCCGSFWHILSHRIRSKAITTVHCSVRPCITRDALQSIALARRHARNLHANACCGSKTRCKSHRIARPRSKTAPPAPRCRRARHSLLRANNCALQLVAWRARLAAPRARWKCCNKLTPCTPASSSSSSRKLKHKRPRVVVVARPKCETARRSN